jgi:ATPase family associated with various cellular activities (AAA)
MSGRTNAAAVMEVLEQSASSGSSVAQSFASLTSFAQTAGSAAVLSTLPGIGHLLAAVSVAAGAADQVIKVTARWRSRSQQIPVYDQFQVLFYTACHRSYLESLAEQLQKYKPQEDPSPRPAPNYRELNERARAIIDADVTYLLCVDPAEIEIPLFNAYNRWLTSVLPDYGIPGHDSHGLVKLISDGAKLRLKIFLSQQTPDAAWMRDFLALSHQEHTNRVLTTVGEVANSLKNWTSNDVGNVKQRYKASWDDYRKALINLPDQNDSMFAENFGVRKVFIAPQGSYLLIGTSDEPHVVNNLPKLLGALVSERLAPGELRILCGGPGSGKSTVCRMLASELAKNETIHPVFLRLRRMKEGADIAAYVEESLRNEGLIDRLSDVREISNLVLVLDGFDELVMASRTRLRNFFNVLREELASGPLRSARAIVSGRDTLFPGGDGLPVGAHVLTLLPFDSPRVAAWGKKWRTLHSSSPGSDFYPEKLLPNRVADRHTPLQHLVSWPLTLHLLARVHTRGSLRLSDSGKSDIEKAYLYRSIMADTAQRQTTQAEGQGRFDRAQMQRFMRFLAWTMYSRGTDSLDFDDVIPLVQRFYPDASEAEVTEVTDVAIVNAPELTKGEQTGCEFVHKSFSEYLVAEHIAESIERVAFKAAEFGLSEPTWRMSPSDATVQLASIFASRLLTPEVQEMLDPMLGCVESFFSNDSIDKVRESAGKKDALERIIERLEMMLGGLAQGQHLEAISKAGVENGLAETAFEALSNYCASIMIVGTAAARRASLGHSGLDSEVYFNGEPVVGAFWKCIGVLQAGGASIDEALGRRLFAQMRLPKQNSRLRPNARTRNHEISDAFEEHSFPIKFREFRRIRGYKPTISEAIDALIVSLYELLIAIILLLLDPGYHRYESRWQEDEGTTRLSNKYKSLGLPGPILPSVYNSIADLYDAGFADQNHMVMRRVIPDVDRMMELIMHHKRTGLTHSAELREVEDLLERVARDIVEDSHGQGTGGHLQASLERARRLLVRTIDRL